VPERFAFRMNLNPGQAAEYQKRHDEIFPEMVEVLKDAGISDYTIWHDPETDHLFAILTRSDNHKMNQLPESEVVQRWWKHMADIMETDAQNVPTQVPLRRVFFLP
jgi:L-rhamnose mutarotase